MRAPARRELITAAVALMLTLVGTRASTDHDEVPATAGAYLLAGLAALTILGATVTPRIALALNGVLVAGFLLLGSPMGPILALPAVLAVLVGLAHPVRIVVTGCLWCVAPLVVATVLWWAGVVRTDQLSLWDAGQFLAIQIAFIGGAAAVGSAVRARRIAVARESAAQARRAVSEERLRMARDLHDTVGHTLAVVAMQSGVALRLLQGEPDRVRELLTAIRDVSRDSLDSVRGQLVELQAGERSPLLPEPAIDDLPALVERVRSAGVEVHLRVDAGELPPAVGAAAYRIAQESLTNVLRHSGAARAAVTVTGSSGVVRVVVTDDGRGSTGEPSAGTGISGMRSRATALGGELTAAPVATGGFEVAAVLPLPDGHGQR